jgi:hypothetical protein
MQVMALYITGDLNAIFSPEHKKELLRYLYNHQVYYYYYCCCYYYYFLNISLCTCIKAKKTKKLASFYKLVYLLDM